MKYQYSNLVSLCGFCWVLVIIFYVSDSGAYAQNTDANVSAQAKKMETRPQDRGDVGIREICWIAERAINSASHTLNLVFGLLLILVGGTAFGVVSLYRKFEKILSEQRDDMDTRIKNVDETLRKIGRQAKVARDSLKTTTESYAQLMRNVPLLLMPTVDVQSRTVAINTLAQLRQPELRALYTQLLVGDSENDVKRCAVYALGMLEEGGAQSIPELLIASKSDDALLRRGCARALVDIGVFNRDVVERFEEMLGDVDTLVQRHSKEGLEKAMNSKGDG